MHLSAHSAKCAQDIGQLSYRNGSKQIFEIQNQTFTSTELENGIETFRGRIAMPNSKVRLSELIDVPEAIEREPSLVVQDMLLLEKKLAELGMIDQADCNINSQHKRSSGYLSSALGESFLFLTDQQSAGVMGPTDLSNSLRVNASLNARESSTSHQSISAPRKSLQFSTIPLYLENRASEKSVNKLSGVENKGFISSFVASYAEHLIGGTIFGAKVNPVTVNKNPTKQQTIIDQITSDIKRENAGGEGISTGESKVVGKRFKVHSAKSNSVDSDLEEILSQSMLGMVYDLSFYTRPSPIIIFF